MNNWEEELYRQYADKRWDFAPKSHWLDCDWSPSQDPVKLFSNAPARYITCNACLRRRGYIRIVHCDPRLVGWPYERRNCEKCNYGGIDCETWLRVRGIGEGVEQVLKLFDEEAYQAVTWGDTGFVPFKNDEIFFSSKSELDRYVLDVLLKYGIRVRDQWPGGYVWEPSPQQLREREQEDQRAIQERIQAAKLQEEQALQTQLADFNEWFARKR